MTALLKVFQPEPDEMIISRVEALLEQARSGELQAFGYAAVLKDGSIQTAIFNEGPRVNNFTMLGALERVKARYHNAISDE